MVRMESICRQQINSDSKIEICIGKSRKHCEKRRKCWLPAFLLFSQCFQKLSFPEVLKVEIVWLRVKSIKNLFSKILAMQILSFNNLRNSSVGNILGVNENCHPKMLSIWISLNLFGLIMTICNWSFCNQK